MKYRSQCVDTETRAAFCTMARRSWRSQAMGGGFRLSEERKKNKTTVQVRELKNSPCCSADRPGSKKLRKRLIVNVS